MPDHPAADDGRQRSFELAHRRSELDLPELWLRYIALGGSGDVFDLDSHLQGLLLLPEPEQDVLAQALNERLREVYLLARVPLAGAPHHPPDGCSLRAAVDELLHPLRGPPDGPHPGADGPGR